MNVLTKELQLKLSTVLMEYFNSTDWKELFALTDCEEFAQKHTQFYEDVTWENEALEKASAEAVALILNKDSTHLKVIWEFPGVQTMSLRKSEDFHAQIEALFEVEDSKTSSHATEPYPELTDENQNPYITLDDAEKLLSSKRTIEAFVLMHVALRNFLLQACKDNETSTNENDSISILHAKVCDHIKQQSDTSQNDTSLSMLRTATQITETIDDLSQQTRNENHLNKADVKYAINVSRSVMTYLDELMS